MNIGVVCYASVGGSGIVATELAKSLARRGHQVHLISTEPPFRLGDYEAGLINYSTPDISFLKSARAIGRFGKKASRS